MNVNMVKSIDDDMMLMEYEAELEERERDGEEEESFFTASGKSLGEDLMESINIGAFDVTSTKVSRYL